MAETFQVNARDTHFDVARIGAGKEALVMLPGLSLKRVVPSAAAVEAAYAALLDEYTIFLIDAREEVFAGLTIGHMAEDVAAVMGQLGLSSAHVFGASMGGMIAQELTLQHGQLVKSLTVVSSAPRVPAARMEGLERWIAGGRAHDAVALNRAMRQAIYSPAFLEQFAEAFAALEADASPAEMDRVATLVEAVCHHDALDRLGSVTCPAFVVAGGLDAVFGPEPSQEMAAALGCDCLVFPDASHALFDEEPAFKTSLLEFLRSIA